MKFDKFGSIFEFVDLGQVVAIKDVDTDGQPIIQFKFKVPGSGVCTLNMGVADPSKIDENFKQLTSDAVHNIIKTAADGIPPGTFDD